MLLQQLAQAGHLPAGFLARTLQKLRRHNLVASHRGAVPIVLATFPLTAGVEKANVIFNLVFFISITSILLQGTTLPVVAKWLRLTLPAEIRKKSMLDKELTPKGKPIMTQVTIGPSCPCIGKQLVELQLGSGILVTSILRRLASLRPPAIPVVGIVDVDLFLPDAPYVIGEADRDAGAAVFSLSRLS